MRELPRAARLYLIVSYLLGLGAMGRLLFCCRRTPRLEEWLLAAGLALLAATTQLFVVARARSSYSDHLTPAPLFAAFLLLPAPLLALVICLTFLPEWIWYRRKWFIQSFNIASWLISCVLGRWALFLFTQHFRMERTLALPALAIVLTMPVFLGTQTLLLAWALKLARGHSITESGLFAPSQLCVGGALLCSGWTFAASWAADPLYGIAAAVPLALIFQALHVPNLKEEAATDAKTGLVNMRHFNAQLARDVARADRNGQPASLLMCDLDYLRNINNSYGHQAGDVILRGVADVIQRTIRACDVAGRFGGEEFVILLSDTDSAGAQQVAERLRCELEQSRFAIGGAGASISVTISIGGATFPDDGHTPEALLREADLAVYQAKREGRNRVVMAGRTSRELAGEWAREYLMPVPAAAEAADTGLPFWRFISDVTRLSVNAPSRPEIAFTPRPATGGALRYDRRKRDEPRPQLQPRVAAFIGAIGSAGLIGLLPDLTGGLPAIAVARPALTLFAGLTILAHHLGVDVDQKRGKISVAAVPILGASFLYGGLGSLVTAAAFAFWAKVRARSPLYRMLFNCGNALLAAEGATWTFKLLVARPVAQTPFENMLLPGVVAGLVYYAIHHLLLCLVRGLTEGRRPWHIWLAEYHWLGPHYAVLGALGVVIALGYITFGWTGLLALMAPVAMMHLAIKQYRDRTAVYVDELQRMNGRLSDSYEATLRALTRALDTRDEETQEHSQRVRRYTELIARKHGVPEDELEHIARGALLHDIGKIGVPDAILLKAGRLTDEEQAQMRKHPTIGYSMITHIPFLTKAANVVLHHHEAYDGSGYPSRLSGESIPLGARIFAVADAFDAMTSDRPYRKALPYTVALAEIERCRGTQFDPRVIDALLAIPLAELLGAGEEPSAPAEQPSDTLRSHPEASNHAVPPRSLGPAALRSA